MATPKAYDDKFVDLVVKIEKYPYAVSPLLIDEFYIFGYTDYIINEKIIKPTISDVTSKKIMKNIII